MLRRALLPLLAAALLAGCGDDPKPPSTAPSAVTSLPAEATPSTEASPAASPSPAVHLTVDGAGPYALGAKLADLQADGLVADVATGGETCPVNSTATGTGVWQEVRLQFRPDGDLYLVINRAKTIPTPSGAWIGMSLASLSSIYGNLGQELNGGAAYLVTTSNGRGILFDLDAKKKVMAMIAGDAAYLKSSYENGTDFC